MLGTLAAGVPLVVVPTFADQFANGRSVQACGAGRTVEATAVEPGGQRTPVSAVDVPRIAKAIRDVLADPSYRREAERIAREIAGAPLPADVLAAITR